MKRVSARYLANDSSVTGSLAGLSIGTGWPSASSTLYWSWSWLLRAIFWRVSSSCSCSKGRSCQTSFTTIRSARSGNAMSRLSGNSSNSRLENFRCVSLSAASAVARRITRSGATEVLLSRTPSADSDQVVPFLPLLSATMKRRRPPASSRRCAVRCFTDHDSLSNTASSTESPTASWLRASARDRHRLKIGRWLSEIRRVSVAPPRLSVTTRSPPSTWPSAVVVPDARVARLRNDSGSSDAVTTHSNDSRISCRWPSRLTSIRLSSDNRSVPSGWTWPTACTDPNTMSPDEIVYHRSRSTSSAARLAAGSTARQSPPAAANTAATRRIAGDRCGCTMGSARCPVRRPIIATDAPGRANSTRPKSATAACPPWRSGRPYGSYSPTRCRTSSAS